MSNTYSNNCGTMCKEFKIGKTGTTIFSREEVPASSLGRNGDYCTVMSIPTLLQKRQGEWHEIGTYDVYHVNANATVPIVSPKSLVTVDASQESATILITLDAIQPVGYEMIIKVLGDIALNTTVEVQWVDNGSTIDTVPIVDNNGKITLISTGNGIITL